MPNIKYTILVLIIFVGFLTKAAHENSHDKTVYTKGVHVNELFIIMYYKVDNRIYHLDNKQFIDIITDRYIRYHVLDSIIPSGINYENIHQSSGVRFATYYTSDIELSKDRKYKIPIVCDSINKVKLTLYDIKLDIYEH